MTATKPQPARTAKTPKAAPSSPGSGARLRETEAVKVAPTDAERAKDEDFEHHDTIPAPTWFGDGSEASS